MTPVAAKIVNIVIKLELENYADTLDTIAKAARSEYISVEMGSRNRYYNQHLYHRLELVAEDTERDTEELQRVMNNLILVFINDPAIHRWDTNVWNVSIV